MLSIRNLDSMIREFDRLEWNYYRFSLTSTRLVQMAELRTLIDLLKTVRLTRAQVCAPALDGDSARTHSSGLSFSALIAHLHTCYYCFAAIAAIAIYCITLFACACGHRRRQRSRAS